MTMHPVFNYTLILLLLFLLTSCTNMVPRKNLPYPLTDKSFADPVKEVSIPLPVIASSPNEGVTYGALSAFLLHNSKDEVSTLLAPQGVVNLCFLKLGPERCRSDAF